MSKTACTLAVAAFTLVSAIPATAQQKPNEPSADQVKALIAQAQKQIAQDPAAPVAPLDTQAGPVVNLTEKEAVDRGREKNLTLISERITPQTWDFTMAATRATYLPTLTSAIGNNNQTQLSTSALSGGVKTTNEQQSWSAGMSKRMWRGGGNYSLSWTNNRTYTSSAKATCNPCFSSGFEGLFTQPLLRNFRIDSTRAQVLTNEISQDIADLNLSGQVVSILAQIRNAYWELVYAREAVQAAQASLELASRLVQDNRLRVEIGSMAPIDIVQAQAEEASRRQQLVNAQAILRNNELGLKRLIVSGTDDELWRATIVPTDRPIMTATPIDLEGAVRTALSQRTDLAVTRKNLESTDVSLRNLENETKPALDLIGTMNLSGRAGQGITRTDPVTGISVTPPNGSYFDALGHISSFEAPTWNVRLNFSYPLGNSAPKANIARQRLLRTQTEASIKAVELQIATEVTAAALAVRNSLESLQAAQVSRQLTKCGS